MITEKDLQEAIAECEGQRNPNANTCIKLAAFYTIKQHMFDNGPDGYSYASGPQVEESTNEPTVSYTSDTEFGGVVGGLSEYQLMSTIDELMTALSVVNPRLYSSAMRKIEDLSILHP